MTSDSILAQKKKAVDDNKKYILLSNPWKPDRDYQLPFSAHNKNNKTEKRYLSQSHLEKFQNWLTFSHVEQGLYCKFCALMSDCGGISHQTPLQKLVKKPLTTFAKLLGKDGDLVTHEQHNYHKEAVQRGHDFMRAYLNPSHDVVNQINSARLAQIKENRERLKPIIKSIILLGRQNIPVRGHRDDGKLLCDSDDEESLESEDEKPADRQRNSNKNEGNLRELLKFRVDAGDQVLEKHLKSSASNATYISKTIQTELISLLGESITNTIVQRVKENIFFSILLDETTDVSGIEQLSLSLRYILNGEIREDFVAFVDALEYAYSQSTVDTEPKLTGKVLAETVLQLMKDLSLDIRFCIGCGTDRCSVMSSQSCGAAAEISKQATSCTHCICANHCLNLSLSKTSDVQAVRNAMGTIKQVASFFRASAKRRFLQRQLFKADNESSRNTVMPLCETRWVERHDSVISFRQSLGNIVAALENVAKWHERDSASKAKNLATALLESEFIIALYCISDILVLTQPLSKTLQAENFDLLQAAEHSKRIVEILQFKRKNADSEFHALFAKATEAAMKLEVEFKIPRQASRQINRVNIDTLSVEEYYRIAIYIPMLENMTSDLLSRFDKHQVSAMCLSRLIPEVLIKTDVSETSFSFINDSVKRYSGLIPELKSHDHEAATELVHAEIKLWKQYWVTSSQMIPKTGIEALNSCSRHLYPCIYNFLLIFCTLPVSVATAERSFSTLRRLKTWMRSRMTGDRLTGLALMHTHRDIDIDIDSIITLFGNKKSRKRTFVL
ncbi:52 kDa repressor of the inhibitor of the protein kinase [Biomphalaria glabrata]